MRQKIITSLWAVGALICLVLAIKAAIEAQWVLAIHWAVGFLISAFMVRKSARTPEIKDKPREE